MRTYRIMKKRAECLRRFMFFTFIFVLIIILGIWNNRAVSVHENHAGHSLYYKSIEVKAGDTLWDIAAEYMDDSYSSVNEYMNELIEINQLGSGRIHEGRYLTIVYQL